MPRGVVEQVEAIEEKPVAGVLMGMNGLGYLFIITALAAGIAWIVYVAKAVGNDVLGDKSYQVYTHTPGNSQNVGQANLNTATVAFQAAVVSVLFYFVARHHFSNLHY